MGLSEENPALVSYFKRNPYDIYILKRLELPFLDTQPVNYRPNNYRPDSSGWVSRSPSPDYYGPPARYSDSDYQEHTPSWARFLWGSRSPSPDHYEHVPGQ
jgi:hypothetical protein